MKRILLLAAFAASTAHAEFKTGNKLYEQLRGDTLDTAHALGYIMGVADSIQGVAYCPRDGMTAGQMSDTVKNYLEQRPQNRHLSADVIVTAVLKAHWPCPERKNSNGRGDV